MTTFYAESDAVAADLHRRGVGGAEMTVTMHNGRLIIQYTRPSDAGLDFAESAQEAADLLLSPGVDRVRMAYDIEAGREVKRLVASGGSHFA